MKRLFCFLLLLLVPLMVMAQNIIAPPQLRKRLPIRQALEIRELTVTTEIRDGVATTQVDHVFYNPGARWEEGTFIFPLPEGAHIEKFSMWIGGKETEGELLDAKKAASIYTDIVRRMVDPALLEFQGSGLLRARVFPIEARSEKRVRLSYTHLLERDDRLLRFNWPLRACRLGGDRIGSFSFTANVHSRNALQTVYAPNLPMTVERKGRHDASVSYKAQGLKPDRNLELLISSGGEALAMDLLTHTNGNEHYFWMTLMPTINNDEVVDRDLVFVIDTSGSMDGAKMDQAKRAMHFCINNLNPGDRFEIVRFSTETSALADTWLEASGANRDKARKFVDGMRAIGGTNMGEALERVARLPDSGSRPRTMFLLSDGKPTIGWRDESDLMARTKELGSLRIFPFGIGFDINTHLLDKMAETSGGWRTYVTPDEDLELKLSDHFTKIQSPVLGKLRLQSEGVTLLETHPKKMPELFKGTPLHLFGKYTGNGKGRIILRGEINGKSQRFAFNANFAENESGNEFIPGLWAQRRVGYLLDQVRLGDDDEELVKEVVRLARLHGIVTPYTSFLIQEDEEVNRPGERVVEGFFSQPRRRIQGAVDLKDSRQKSGRGSVSASRDIQEMAQADSRPASAPMAKEAGKKREQQVSSMVVAGRAFYQQDELWLDSSLETVRTSKHQKLVYASKAYFTMLEKHPELAPIFALGQQVRFLFAGTLYEIAPEPN